MEEVRKAKKAGEKLSSREIPRKLADEALAEVRLKELKELRSKVSYLEGQLGSSQEKLEKAKKAIYGLVLSGFLYNEAIAKAPSQRVYEQIFLPELLKEDDVLTKQGIMKKALEVTIESLENVKVNDVLELMGIEKRPLPKYDGKYVNELPEKEKKKLIDTYLAFMVNKQAEEFLEKQRKTIIKKIEEKLK